MCIIYPLEPIQVTFRPFFVKKCNFLSPWPPKMTIFLVDFFGQKFRTTGPYHILDYQLLKIRPGIRVYMSHGAHSNLTGSCPKPILIVKFDFLWKIFSPKNRHFSDFRHFTVLHTLKICKNDENRKNDDFFGENIFHRKSNFTIKIGFGHDPVRLLWAPMGHIHPNTRPYFQKLIIPVYGMALWYEIFGRKNRPKIVIFGGHGDKKLHFFTKNGRNVTWMGSNGYIMHITYLNYVDISPAEPKKSIFRVCKTIFSAPPVKYRHNLGMVMCIIYPLEPIQVTFRPFFVKKCNFLSPWPPKMTIFCRFFRPKIRTTGPYHILGLSTFWKYGLVFGCICPMGPIVTLLGHAQSQS